MLLSALALALPQAQAKSIHPDSQLRRGEVQAYGEWLAGCDNRGDCTLLGIPGEPGLAAMAIRITLAGPADAAPVVELVPFGPSGVSTLPPQAFYLDVEFKVAAITPPHGFSRAELVRLEADAVLAHLAEGKPLMGKGLSDNQPRVRFASAGFARAWRAMAARRAALLRSARASGQLRRIPATEVMVSGFAPIFAMKVCGVNIMRDMRRFLFVGGGELWSYRCGEGALPPRSFWQVTPDVMVWTKPLDLPEPRLGTVRAGTAGLENAVFDFDFGTLREYRYQPGHEDCGTMRAWGFTASGWQLLERREMPLCKGLEPGDWIRTHFTPSLGAGPDE